MICSICKQVVKWYQPYYIDKKVTFFEDGTYYFIDHYHRKCYRLTHKKQKSTKKDKDDNTSNVVYT
jgi:hypothetical protein